MKSSCALFILKLYIDVANPREIENWHNTIITLGGAMLNSLLCNSSFMVVCMELIDQYVNDLSISCSGSKMNSLRT
jgi:hypothetical protein